MARKSRRASLSQSPLAAVKGLASSDLRVRPQVPGEVRRRAERAVGLLLLVLDLDLDEVEAHLVDRQGVAGAATLLHGAHQHVGEGVLEELKLAGIGFRIGGPQSDEDRVDEVLSAGAGLHEKGRCLADLRREVEVLKGNSAGARAGGAGGGMAGVGLAPVE